MRLKLVEVVALASFILGFATYMKLKKHWLTWFFGAVCATTLAIILFRPPEPTSTGTPTQTSTTTGNNSPAINMTATASGTSSTVNQIGQQQVNINPGVPKDIVERIIREKEIRSHKELTAKYPEGYVLLGVADGQIVYQPRLKDFKVEADWEHATLGIKDNVLELSIPSFGFEVFANGHTGRGNRISATIRLPANASASLIENKAISLPAFPGLPKMYFDILDLADKIFLIGFRNQPFR
jgi:hypothetical protein